MPRACLTDAVLYRAALFRVQPFEMRKGYRLRDVGQGGHPTRIHVFVRNRLVLICPGGMREPAAQRTAGVDDDVLAGAGVGKWAAIAGSVTDGSDAAPVKRWREACHRQDAAAKDVGMHGPDWRVEPILGLVPITQGRQILDGELVLLHRGVDPDIALVLLLAFEIDHHIG